MINWLKTITANQVKSTNQNWYNECIHVENKLNKHTDIQISTSRAGFVIHTYSDTDNDDSKIVTVTVVTVSQKVKWIKCSRESDTNCKYMFIFNVNYLPFFYITRFL